MTAPALVATRPSASHVFEDVRQVFADVTRYPRDILEREADLEGDLGIDSVKLGEVFSVLRERYPLPSAAEIQARIPAEQMRTLGGIAEAIVMLSDETAPRGSAPVLTAADSVGTYAPPSTTAPPVASPGAVSATYSDRPTADVTASDSDVIAHVRAVFATVTRYPTDILEPDADLEGDLGIDSVKLGEVFSALRERYPLPPADEIQQRIAPDAMRTIRGVAEAIRILSVPVRSVPVETRPSIAMTGASPRADTMPEDRGQVFKGRIALVTGSGHGLGKVIAQRLSSLGATVVVNSFHSRTAGEETVAELQRAGGDAHHVWASVANPTQLAGLYDAIEERYGALDFFVSCSSNGMLAPLEQITAEHWEKAFRTNIIGLHQGALRAAALMRGRGGRIVTLSTTGANRYLPYFGCMAPVKAAVEALTRYLAIELADYGVRVNCVSAGPVYGDLLAKWPESATLIPHWESITPGGRLATADDVAESVLWLLSDGAAMMNGSILTIDGGQSVRL